MTTTIEATTADSPSTVSTLRRATQSLATRLCNDSADPVELERSISFGAVGATCNPVIALMTIKKNPAVWTPRLASLAAAYPTAGVASRDC